MKAILSFWIFSVFCAYYVLNGVLAERPYEILVFVIATVIVWVYIIANYALRPGDGPIKLVSNTFSFYPVYYGFNIV